MHRGCVSLLLSQTTGSLKNVDVNPYVHQKLLLNKHTLNSRSFCDVLTEEQLHPGFLCVCSGAVGLYGSRLGREWYVNHFYCLLTVSEVQKDLGRLLA